MSNRSRTDVVEDILRVIANGDGRRLRITYGAYVSYEQLEEYADFMVKQGLVYKEEGSELYKLTLKGEGFLRSSEHVDAKFASSQVSGTIGPKSVSSISRPDTLSFHATSKLLRARGRSQEPS